MISVTCPYCNAPLESLPADAISTLRQLPCPRCGEAIPSERWPVGESTPVPEVGATPPGKRSTALIVVGIMALFACLSLAFALSTVEFRQRKHPVPPERIPVAIRRPSELPALRQLPPNMTLVAGVHWAEWLQDPAGKKMFLEWAGKSLEKPIQFLKDAGLHHEDIDHVVLGIGPVPQRRAILIVKIRRPYDLEKLREKLQPTSAILYRDRPLYEIKLPTLGKSYFWGSDPQTMVFLSRLDFQAGPNPDDLQDLPIEPKTQIEALSPSLTKILAERVGSSSLAWGVGDISDQPDVMLMKTFLPPNLAPLADVQRFAFGIQPQNGVTLLGHLQTSNAKSSQSLQGYFEKLALPASQKLTAATDPGADASWVSIQWRADPSQLPALGLPK